MAKTMQDAILHVQESVNLLDKVDDALGALAGHLHELVEWTNTQGTARVSATIYKLIADIDYLQGVAPGIVQAVLDDLEQSWTKTLPV